MEENPRPQAHWLELGTNGIANAVLDVAAESETLGLVCFVFCVVTSRRSEVFLGANCLTGGTGGGQKHSKTSRKTKLKKHPKNDTSHPPGRGMPNRLSQDSFVKIEMTEQGLPIDWARCSTVLRASKARRTPASGHQPSLIVR